MEEEEEATALKGEDETLGCGSAESSDANGPASRSDTVALRKAEKDEEATAF